jgi:integrase
VKQKSAGQVNDEAALWETTARQNLIRYVPSGTYFARLKVKGKLIRRALKTKVFSVAKLRLGDLEKEERQRAENYVAVANGKMTFGDALAIYRSRIEGDVRLKPRSKVYREERIAALLKSWPGLEQTDVQKISKADCLDWANRYQKRISGTNYNNTVGSLKQVLGVAVESGARYDNPAQFIKRARIRVEEPTLPSPQNFEKVVACIKHDSCRDLVQFLAFGGFRKSEAANITWHDINFEKGEILVRGDALTGTKNWEIRRVPMIREMRNLLQKLNSENPDVKPTDKVMRAKECQGSIDSACKQVGIPRFTHHGLRHLFVTRCLEAGIDPLTVARWAGHKDSGVLVMKRYGHLRDHHSKAMAEKVMFSTTSMNGQEGSGKSMLNETQTDKT